MDHGTMADGRVHKGALCNNARGQKNRMATVGSKLRRCTIFCCLLHNLINSMVLATSEIWKLVQIKIIRGTSELPCSLFCALELELELIQTQMTQKQMLREEVGMRVRCANKASAECIMKGRGIGQNSRKYCKKRGICG